MHEPNNTFWKNVKAQLDIRGANWAWLRDKIGGKAASSMSNMILKWPRLDDALKIAAALGVSLEVLCSGMTRPEMASLALAQINAAAAELPAEDLEYLRVVIETLRWKARRAHAETV